MVKWEKFVWKEYKRMLKRNPKRAGVIFIDCIISQGKEIDALEKERDEYKRKCEELEKGGWVVKEILEPGEKGILSG